MTVSYSRLVANGSSFGCFGSILRKWKGSVYKLVWRELIVYMLLYFAINMAYRYALTEPQQRIFEQVRAYFRSKSQSIPMSFVLGFYVTLVVRRWWEQYRLLPWPDTLALFVSAAIPGADERGRLMRRTIVRYAVLAYIITLKHVSVRVKKRFPSLQHIVDAGFMVESEKKIVEMMDARHPMAKYWMPLVWATNVINRARKDSLITSDQLVQTLLVELSEIRRRLGAVISYDTVCVPLVYTQKKFFHYWYIVNRSFGMCVAFMSSGGWFMVYGCTAGFLMESEKKIFEMLEVKTPMTKYWLPLTWATNIINRARKDLLITSDHMVQTILLEMSDIRSRLGSLIGYDNVNIPIVYTQVVTLSVYAYFLAALIGAQMIPLPEESALKKSDDIDLYFPVITVLEFGFYIGWLKVAEVLIGPFGEDDDDIELNWLIDRHIKAAYMIVDEMHEEHPELLKDQYWDEVVPKDLPYTVGSEHYRREEPKGSADSYKVKDSDALYANISSRRKSALPDDMYADYESVDTPVVERRKNWFQKQISRMGSIRSSSTTYSSTGQIRPTRRNSMYSTAETMVAGSGVNIPGSITIPTGQSTKQDSSVTNATYSNHKMSLYDRLAGRRSARAVKIKSGANKMNGSVPTTLKNRPRIPTPDVSKESNENIRLNHTMNGTHHQNLGSNVNYPSEFPVVQVLLSPIQELEGLPTSSSAGALSAASGTTALAQAVLPPTLQSVGLNSMPAVTMAVNPVALGTVSLGQPLSLSQKLFSTMARSSATGRVTSTTGVTPVILTDITHAPSEKDDTSGNCTGSDISNASSATEEVSSGRNMNLPQKRGEVYV